MKRTSALYGIVVGIAIGLLWLLLLATGQVPELETAPGAIGCHLVAEGLTALLLITAGVGLLRRTPWSWPLHRVAMGMLLYSAINSMGYYLDRADGLPMIVLFVVVILLTSGLLWASRSRTSRGTA